MRRWRQYRHLHGEWACGGKCFLFQKLIRMSAEFFSADCSPLQFSQMGSMGHHSHTAFNGGTAGLVDAPMPRLQQLLTVCGNVIAYIRRTLRLKQVRGREGVYSRLHFTSRAVLRNADPGASATDRTAVMHIDQLYDHGHVIPHK